jgi:hypothetical protein
MVKIGLFYRINGAIHRKENVKVVHGKSYILRGGKDMLKKVFLVKNWGKW